MQKRTVDVVRWLETPSALLRYNRVYLQYSVYNIKGNTQMGASHFGGALAASGCGCNVGALDRRVERSRSYQPQVI